jgi:hypothetical protein
MNRTALGRLSCLVSILALVASGCAGPPGASSQSSAPAAIPAAGAPHAHRVRGELRIRIPRLKKHRRKAAPAFVSPSTKSLAVTINGGAAQTFDVAVPPCTAVAGGALECTFSVVAPLGSVTFAVSLYDGANATGTLLGSGSATQNISSGGFGPTITITPVAGSIVLSLADAGITPRVPSTTTLTVKELDPDGNPITGPYPSAITLTSTDTTGAVTLSTATVTGSGQAVTVTYNGSTQLYGGAAIAATASGLASGQAPLTIATPCAPTYTPTTLYAMWDTYYDNLQAFAPPYTETGATLGSLTYPVFISIDPAGHIFVTQANTSGYPSNSANVVYYTPPSMVQTSVTPSNLNMYGVAVDDQGNLFVSENSPSGVYEAAGPLPAFGSNYATPVLIPNSPTGTYALLFDKYCNLFVDGTVAGKPFVEVLPTTGQSGGGYGQLTPVINTSSAFTAANGIALDSKGDLFVAGTTTIQELAPPYTGTPTTLGFTVQMPSYMASLTTDPSDDLFFADYAQNTINESSPPYTSFTTVNSGTLSLAVGVVYGPAGPAPSPTPGP